MKTDHFVRDQSCTDPERRWGGGGGGGGGGGRWPGLNLKIHKFYREYKQLSWTPTPGKCWTSLELKRTVFFESDSWTLCKQVEDVEPTVDKFEDQKVDNTFFCQILSCPPPPLPHPPPPPPRRKSLDPRMSVMLFSELMEYNKGISIMSNMLGVSRPIYWTGEVFWNKMTSTWCGKFFQLSDKPQSLQNIQTSTLRRYKRETRK